MRSGLKSGKRAKSKRRGVNKFGQKRWLIRSKKKRARGGDIGKVIAQRVEIRIKKKFRKKNGTPAFGKSYEKKRHGETAPSAQV